jgi:RimJ/RimL family protein N-acetyltransferase
LERKGVGTELINKVIEFAVEVKARRVWLITTNDNIDAIKFYQKRGFRIIRIHTGAIDLSRKLKPSIPVVGNYGIPIRDEIELEMKLKNKS